MSCGGPSENRDHSHWYELRHINNTHHTHLVFSNRHCSLKPPAHSCNSPDRQTSSGDLRSSSQSPCLIISAVPLDRSSHAVCRLLHSSGFQGVALNQHHRHHLGTSKSFVLRPHPPPESEPLGVELGGVHFHLPVDCKVVTLTPTSPQSLIGETRL